MDRRLLLLCIIPLAAIGCAQPPAALSGGPYAEVTVMEAHGHDQTGTRVRWGGSIVTTTPGKDETCFEILSRPLDEEARPRRTDQTDGRFLACAPGFYDPAVYEPGRELTVIGTLQAPSTGRIGEHEYRYARVQAEKVYLWPKRQAQRTVYYYYDPWWPGPFWYPYWGPWPRHPWPRHR